MKLSNYVLYVTIPIETRNRNIEKTIWLFSQQIDLKWLMN